MMLVHIAPGDDMPSVSSRRLCYSENNQLELK